MVKDLSPNAGPVPWSRREILFALPVLAMAGQSAAPEIRFPKRPAERLAVTSWPFRAFIDSPKNHERKANLPGMDLKQFPAFVVEKFGVHNINPLADHFSSIDDAYIAAFRDAVQNAGSHVVDLGLAGRDFYNPDPKVRQNALDYGCKWIDLAGRIGSPSVRQHLNVRQGEKVDVSVAAEGLRQLAEYGAQRSIVVNLENDNPSAEDPFVLVSIIEKVNSPFLRALPDFGNSLNGHDQEYSENGVKDMLPHAWNMCHVKDSMQDDKGQVKPVDLAKMFALAERNSFHGYYSMEFDTDAGDPITGTQKLIKETLQYLR
jgi:sugar phosphate isomerase/epimerase